MVYGTGVPVALAMVPGLSFAFAPGLLGDDQLVRVGYKCSAIVLLMLLILLNKSQARLSSLTWRLTTAALFFSMLGDAALLYKDLFTLGLAFFLVGHLLYAAVFSQGLRLSAVPVLASVGLVVGASAILIPSMLQEQPDLVVPVVLYMLAISSMQLTASCGSRHHRQLATAGAWLFAISDFLIAFNMFVAKVPYSHQLIHALYFVAQALLTLSILFPSTSKKKRSD